MNFSCRSPSRWFGGPAKRRLSLSEELDRQLEALGTQLDEVSEIAASRFTLISSASDDYSRSMREVSESLRLSRDEVHQAFDANLEPEKRKFRLSLRSARERLQERMERALRQYDKDIQNTKSKADKRVSEYRRFVGGLDPLVAIMMRETIKSESTRMGERLRSYIESALKAARKCHNDLEKATSQYTKDTSRLDFVDTTDTTVRTVSEACASALRRLERGIDPKVVFQIDSQT
jgi:hypothetical protein